MELPYWDAPPSIRPESAAFLSYPIPAAVQFGRQVTALLNNNWGEWAGIVLNLSGVSVDKAVEMLPEQNSNK